MRVSKNAYKDIQAMQQSLMKTLDSFKYEAMTPFQLQTIKDTANNFLNKLKLYGHAAVNHVPIVTACRDTHSVFVDFDPPLKFEVV